MKTLAYPIAVLAALFAVDASAGLPQLNATCPGGMDIHVDQGGPVYVNGKEAKLKRSNDNYYEATDVKSGTVFSISNNPDGSSDVSYTGKKGANGVCTLASSSTASMAPAATAAREKHPAAEKACLAAVAKKANMSSSRLSVIEALGAEAGISVSVKVPGADAPWACMTDKKGKPWSVKYTGSEGAL